MAHPASSASQVTEPLLVGIDSGQVIGFVDRHPVSSRSTATQPKGDRAPIAKWLGLPYAQAGRWEHSRRPQPWSEPRPCLEFGAIPPQTTSVISGMYVDRPGYIERDLIEDEDCLSLNIFKPADVPGPLPVLVWIPFGGSFTTGSSALGLYDPSEWIRRSTRDGKPFILVSGNHRLNAFGFISSQDLVDTDPDGLGGNYGLRDNLHYLEWVQRNISKFGGDPARVTAFGESAGAIQIAMLCHTGRTLFQRAILQSGAAASSTLRTVEEASIGWNAIVKRYGIKGATAQERVDAMKKLSTKQIIDCIMPISKLGLWPRILESGPQAIWSMPQAAELMAGKLDPAIQAVIAGTMRDEGTLFAKATRKRRSVASWTTQFPDARRATKVRPTLNKLYPEQDEESLAHAFGDSLFDGPNVHQLKHFSKHVPTYAYRIETTPETLARGREHLAVFHASELAFVFDRDGMWAGEESADGRTSRRIGDAWLDFAYGQEPWQRYDGDEQSVRIFKPAGETEQVSIKGHKTEELAFWDNVVTKRANAQPR